MDYTTSHVFLVLTLGLFTVVLFSLSLVDRTVAGARWLAGSTLIDLVKTVLQGMDGRLPRFATVLIPNELNILAFFCMYMGFRWFLRRKPLHWGVAAAVGASMVVYAGFFLSAALFGLRTRWSFTVMAVPVLFLCGAVVKMLVEQEELRFRVPASIAALLLALQIVLVSYRVGLSLTPVHWVSARGTGWGDPYWMYSQLGIMLVGYCLLLVYVLFTAVEIYSHVVQSAGLDALTGSMNRRALLKHARLELERSNRIGRPFSVIAMDLDHFKRVNDTYGHAGGDAVLCAFVALVKGRLRSEDVVARVGGEEFMVMLPGTDAMTAATVAEMLRLDVERLRVEYEGRSISTTVSAGVTVMLGPDDVWQAMAKRADWLLYQAKSSGRNCVKVDEQALLLKKASERFYGSRESASETASVV
jgi:diguanylate cyclase (GGDEF)-like protein